MSQRLNKQRKINSSLQSKMDGIKNFKEFLVEVDGLQRLQLKIKGVESRIIEELEVNSWKINEFLPYFPTFQLKFAERCQKKWSKKDKSMLLWVVIRYLQNRNKKSLQEMAQEDYENIADILGIKKKTLIQEISQILCLKTSKNPFSKEEKNILIKLVQKYDGKAIKWSQIAQDFNNSFQRSLTLRNIKSLKQVYNNHLNPNLNKKPWEVNEDVQLIDIISQNGKKWQLAANILKCRNQCQVKNEYYKLLREQMQLNKIPTSKKLDFQKEIALLLRYKEQLEKMRSSSPQSQQLQYQQQPSQIYSEQLSSEFIQQDEQEFQLKREQSYSSEQQQNEVENQANYGFQQQFQEYNQIQPSSSYSSYMEDDMHHYHSEELSPSGPHEYDTHIHCEYPLNSFENDDNSTYNQHEFYQNPVQVKVNPEESCYQQQQYNCCQNNNNNDMYLNNNKIEYDQQQQSKQYYNDQQQQNQEQFQVKQEENFLQQNEKENSFSNIMKMIDQDNQYNQQQSKIEYIDGQENINNYVQQYPMDYQQKNDVDIFF